MKVNDFAKQKWVSKFMSGWCVTGKMMKFWRQRVAASFPRCNCKVKDVDHVLLCPAVEAVMEWNSSLENVRAWMDANTSCPNLSKSVMHALSRFKSGGDIVLQKDMLFDGVKRVFKAQSAIGWRLFLDVCLSTEWARVQQQYLTWMGSRKLEVRWVVGLINQ